MAKRLTQQEVFDRCNKIFNNKYNYTNSVFVNTRTPMDIVCPIHGNFSIPPKRHLKGQGCPDCGAEYARTWRKGNWKHFVEESKQRFGDVYDFINIEDEYENSHSKIHIKCKKCGNIFPKIACDHLTSPFGGCHHCYSNISSSELEIGEFVQTLVGDDEVLFGDRTILNGKELDIFIPSKSIAIEFDGLRYHNDSTKPKNYHLSKTKECEKHKIKLIHIFEDEWIYKNDIVKSMLSSLFNSYQVVLTAEDCQIKSIDFEKSSNFLGSNYIHGETDSDINYGLIYNDDIVSIMCFKKCDDGEYKLNGFCNKLNTTVINSELLLFNKFVAENNPNNILFIYDRRNYNVNLGEKLYFKIYAIMPPDHFYVKKDKRIYKNDATQSQIKALHKIYDCGNIVYKWNKNSLENIISFSNIT